MICKKIRLYLKLARLHSSVLTGLAPICTAAALDVKLSIFHYIELFLIGIIFHIYLFVLNEVRDVEIDKTSDSLKSKPLVDGSISIKNAKLLVYCSIVLVIILSFVFFYNQAPTLILISALAFIFGGLYDYFGKKVPHADYFISLMLFFTAIYGAFSVTNQITIFVLIIALLALIQMLINNVTASLKDVDHDFIKGGKSTPLRMGVTVKDGRFHVSPSYLTYVLILKTIHIGLTILPFYLNLISFEIWQLYLVIILIVVALGFYIRFLTIKKFDRVKIMRFIGFHEMFAFMVIPFLLYGLIGFLATVVLIFLPIVWLGIFLIVIYGKLIPEI